VQEIIEIHRLVRSMESANADMHDTLPDIAATIPGHPDGLRNQSQVGLIQPDGIHLHSDSATRRLTHLTVLDFAPEADRCQPERVTDHLHLGITPTCFPIDVLAVSI
jgi:hypothetical protein